MASENYTSQLSVMDLIINAVKLFLENFKSIFLKIILFLLCAFVAADIIALVLRKLLPYNLRDVIDILQWLLKAFSALTAAWATVFAISNPEKATDLAEIIKEYKKNIGRLLLTVLAVFLRFLGLFFILFLGGLFAAMTRASIIGLFFSIPVSIAAIYLFIHYIFVIYLVFEADVKPFNIPTKSSQLVEGSGWKVFGTYLLCSLITAIIILPVFLVFSGSVNLEEIQELSLLTGDIFNVSVIFALIFYAIYAISIIFPLIVFYGFYNKVKYKKTDS